MALSVNKHVYTNFAYTILNKKIIVVVKSKVNK